MTTEDPWKVAFQTYQQTPSPETLKGVVDHLRPTIEYTLASMNGSKNPVLRSRASVVAAKAVSNYKPDSGAELPTYVSSQLRQLTRLARQYRMPIKLPDRVILDSYKLNQAVRRFEDTYGREPDTLELADAAGMSVKRIEKVRGYQVAVPTEEAVGELKGELPDIDREALEYVMHDADHTDRKILEWKTGYGGNPVIPPAEVAARLRLTPSNLSRRSARLSMRLKSIRDMLEKVTI